MTKTTVPTTESDAKFVKLLDIHKKKKAIILQCSNLNLSNVSSETLSSDDDNEHSPEKVRSKVLIKI